MVQFIVSNSSKGSRRLIVRKAKIDSKGRVSIPSDIRKNFGLEEGSFVEIVFDLAQNAAFLNFACGRDGVRVSTEGCEPSGPSSNKPFPREPAKRLMPKNGKSFENLGPGPEERGYRKYEK